jgi:glucose/arabinose dehydrogenase
MVVLIALALLAGLLPIFVTGKPSHGAGTLPDGFEQSRFVGELTNPTAMVLAPDGSLFVAEQRGTLRVVDANGQLQETPFLDARGSIGSSGERGLLGVALDPDFASNNHVYVYYTRKGSRSDPGPQPRGTLHR